MPNDCAFVCLHSDLYMYLYLLLHHMNERWVILKWKLCTAWWQSSSHVQWERTWGALCKLRFIAVACQFTSLALYTIFLVRSPLEQKKIHIQLNLKSIIILNLIPYHTIRHLQQLYNEKWARTYGGWEWDWMNEWIKERKRQMSQRNHEKNIRSNAATQHSAVSASTDGNAKRHWQLRAPK